MINWPNVELNMHVDVDGYVHEYGIFHHLLFPFIGQSGCVYVRGTQKYM